MKQFLFVITFVVGLATVATSQQKLYTVTAFTDDFYASSVTCYKTGGYGISIYELAEDGSGEPVGIACLQAVK